MHRRDISKALLASAAGSALIAQHAEAETRTALDLQHFRSGVDVRRFGIVGDGKTDDTAAFARAISSGQPLDIRNLTIRITRRLIFDQNGQHVFGCGGQLKFDGAATERLMTITANDVRFHGVKFNGNARQVAACLIYCASNAARPKFLSCWFTNIHGTHVKGVQSNVSNCQYAVMISPYGVEGFDFADCIFDEIYNDNSGLNGVTPIVGGGFCGGIFFLTEDFKAPDTQQTVPTSGQIHDCLFKNIKTILGPGLSSAEQQDFPDADGVRFYGSAVTATHLHVSVHDCVFYDCAKRAVKGSVATGVKVSNINVIATTALQYPMVCAVKVDGDDFQLRGMNVYSPATAPIMQVIQTHDGKNLCVEGVFADRCQRFWSMAPTSTSVISSGWRASNLRCKSITSASGSGVAEGIRSDSLGDHFEDCVFANVDFECDPRIHSLQACQFAANTPRMEVVLSNWRVCNGDMKIAGYGALLENIYQEIDDTSFASSVAGRGLLEVGQTPGVATVRDTIVNGYTCNIKSITPGFLAPGRPYFTVIYGDRTKVSNFRLLVPEGYDSGHFHAQFEGSEYTLENVDYSGPGTLGINTFSAGTKSRMTVDGARRIGGTASTSEFLRLNFSEDCVITDVADYRLTSVSSIIISGGTIRRGRTYAYIVDGVWSLSSATNIVTDSGALAKQLNVQRF